MLKGLAQTRPDLRVTVVQSDRPYFRYGSGSWGQALYRVQFEVGKLVFNVYALPSQKVPILVRMRELKQLGMVINCANSHAIVAGQPRILSVTSKGHALLDFAKDIPFQSLSQSSSSHPSSSHMSRNLYLASMLETSLGHDSLEEEVVSPSVSQTVDCEHCFAIHDVWGNFSHDDARDDDVPICISFECDR